MGRVLIEVPDFACCHGLAIMLGVHSEMCGNMAQDTYVYFAAELFQAHSHNLSQGWRATLNTWPADELSSHLTLCSDKHSESEQM